MLKKKLEHITDEQIDKLFELEREYHKTHDTVIFSRLFYIDVNLVLQLGCYINLLDVDFVKESVYKNIKDTQKLEEFNYWAPLNHQEKAFQLFD